MVEKIHNLVITIKSEALQISIKRF